MQIDKERAWREDEDRRRLDRALVYKYEGELDKSGGMRRKPLARDQKRWEEEFETPTEVSLGLLKNNNRE